MVSIHPTAVIENGAALGENVEIGPYTEFPDGPWQKSCSLSLPLAAAFALCERMNAPTIELLPLAQEFPPLQQEEASESRGRGRTGASDLQALSRHERDGKLR